MKPAPELPPAPVTWEQHPLDWPRAAGHADALMAAIAVRQRRQRRRRLGGGALALTMVAGMCFVPWRSQSESVISSPPSGRVVIKAAERRILPDGSIVDLDRDAELTVDFSPSSTGPRTVRLTRGVAHFQVAKNPARPFVVQAGGAQFRAVGTAFAVELNGAAIEMLVTEGRVAVETGAVAIDSPGAALIVDAGNQVVVDLSAAQKLLVSPAPAEVSEQKLAWRIPRLEFNDAPLSEVVRLINEHSVQRLIIGNADLARLPISGALRADHVAPLLQLLEANHRVKVERRSDGMIVLRAER